ncbi:MAG: hypothetical protein Q9163_000576 [Psora crenata]
MADFLNELEGYPDLEGSIIRATKIHKVLKQMIKLEHIPLEEEFKFRDRSAKLLATWNDTLAGDGHLDEKVEDNKTEGKTAPRPGAKPAESKIDENSPTTNGEVQGIEEQDKKAEAGKTIVAEEEEPPVKHPKKIGTTVEGEKEAGAQKNTRGTVKELEKNAGAQQSDAPDIETAPAAEYKPPTEETVQATA